MTAAITRLAKKTKPTRKKARLTRLKLPVPPVSRPAIFQVAGSVKLVAGLGTLVMSA